MKSTQMALKVAPHIHKRLKSEAEARGISMNALIGWLCGEWVANLERVENAAKEQIKLTERLLTKNIEEGLNKGVLMALEEYKSENDSTENE